MMPTRAYRLALMATAAAIRAHLKPPPRLSVSEWADRYRILPETSAEPGPWRTDRAPFLREIMDTASNPEVRRIVFMKPAQCGGSEVLLNILGYFIDQDPAPVLLVQISTGEAAKFSKERVAPMIAASPALRGKVAPARSRDSGNTIDSKAYPGGHLGIVGANAPAGLRSRPRRVLLMDEVDGYPASAGAEGNPRELARKRQTTFWNSLEVEISTPTVKDLSAIEADAEECDELRRYHVRCLHCEELQTLKWGGKGAGYGLKWEKGEDGRVREASYLCEHCGVLIEERYKLRMLRDQPAGGTATWIADEPHPRPTRIAFHLNGLYSPWLSWRELAQEWEDAQGSPLDLQVFVNTRLAETWDDKGSTIEPASLLSRREEYSADPLPQGVVLLTMGVDVQADRLEAEILGWGVGEETWSLEYLHLPGDPTVGKVWTDLDQVLQRTWQHPLGPRLRITATSVDAGYMAQQVKKYAADRLDLNVWAVKGIDGFGRPIFNRPQRNTRGKVPLYPVGVDTAKTVIYGRLAILPPPDWDGGPVPGLCHFPSRAPYDEEYFRQLTAEKVVLRQTPGRQLKRAWVRRPGRRAEALDCRVYAMAALEGLVAAGWRLQHVSEAIRAQPSVSEDDETAPAAGRSSWIHGWRG